MNSVLRSQAGISSTGCTGAPDTASSSDCNVASVWRCRSKDSCSNAVKAFILSHRAFLLRGRGGGSSYCRTTAAITSPTNRLYRQRFAVVPMVVLRCWRTTINTCEIAWLIQLAGFNSLCNSKMCLILRCQRVVIRWFALFAKEVITPASNHLNFTASLACEPCKRTRFFPSHLSSQPFLSGCQFRPDVHPVRAQLLTCDIPTGNLLDSARKFDWYRSMTTNPLINKRLVCPNFFSKSNLRHICL